MTPHGHVALVGASRRLADAARSLDLRVTAVDRAGRAGRLDGLGVERVIASDYVHDRALPDLLAQLHEVDPLDACVSVTEYGLALAAEVSARLGLGGPSPESVATTRDKRAFRAAMDGAGLTPVRWAAVDGAEGLAAACAEVGYPLVLKPAAGVASDGVRLLTGEEDRKRAAAECSLEGEPWIAEERLEGPEFSVEGFSFGSRHVVLAVTEKATAPGGFVEVGHALPAQLGPAEAAAIADIVPAVLSAVGVRDCSTHTELILTADGPRVVETHTRLGGDYIPDLVQIVTGHDLYELSVGWAAGRCREVGPEVVADGAAAVRFAVGEPGQLVSLVGLEPLRSSPSILRAEPLKAVGETVASLGASWDRVAYVISRGATAAEAAELALAGAARIRAVSLPSLRRDQRL